MAGGGGREVKTSLTVKSAQLTLSMANKSDSSRPAHKQQQHDESRTVD